MILTGRPCRSGLRYLKEEDEKMLYIAFPGDEKKFRRMSGGRKGFPYQCQRRRGAVSLSPYSDTCLYRSIFGRGAGGPLYLKGLRKKGALMGEHIGGCVLFEQEEK